MNFLESILTQRRRDIASEKRFVPIEILHSMVADREAKRRSLEAVLRTEPPAIVAEIKRASPSQGAIDLACDPASVAMAYVAAGAVALSVLTEPRRFRGSFADLCSARAAVDVPLLCKDFVVDDFQIWKAAAFGADAVLLIVAALNDQHLRAFLRVAEGLGLDAVAEVHTEQEAQRAVASGARIIGINNRDLTSFQVDQSVAGRIASLIPPSCVALAESGYATAAQIQFAMNQGLRAFLVGEALMRSEDRSRAVADLRAVHA